MRRPRILQRFELLKANPREFFDRITKFLGRNGMRQWSIQYGLGDSGLGLLAFRRSLLALLMFFGSPLPVTHHLFLELTHCFPTLPCRIADRNCKPLRRFASFPAWLWVWQILIWGSSEVRRLCEVAHLLFYCWWDTVVSTSFACETTYSLL